MGKEDASPDAVHPIKVLADGTVVTTATATVSGPVDTELPAAAALADATANPTAPAVGAFLMGWDAISSHWDRVRVSASRLNVDTGGSAVDTELPAAVAASDTLANPTAPSVLGHLLGWTGAVWERVKSVGGAAFVNLRNASGTEVGTAAAPIRTDPTGSTTQPVSGTVTVTPSGTQTVVFQRPTASDLTEAIVDAASSGDNTIVAGTGGQTIRVFKLFFVTDAAVNATIEDGAGGNLTGTMVLRAGAAVVLDFDGEPWFTTASGGAFVINLSSAVGIRGRVYYTKS